MTLLESPSFGFDSDGPKYWIGYAGSWARECKVDPAPCYHHSVDLVTQEFEHLRKVAPIPNPMGVFILSHEVVSRTNAHFEDSYIYSSDNVSKPVGIIVISGKRIPIHHAMTKYLVSHEYGHAINAEWVRRITLKDAEFDKWYISEFRPEANTSYGCGKWHNNVGELIANDFRILLAQRELDFWPHEGHPRPETISKLVDFWNSVKDDLNKD